MIGMIYMFLLLTQDKSSAKMKRCEHSKQLLVRTQISVQPFFKTKICGYKDKKSSEIATNHIITSTNKNPSKNIKKVAV